MKVVGLDQRDVHASQQPNQRADGPREQVVMQQQTCETVQTKNVFRHRTFEKIVVQLVFPAGGSPCPVCNPCLFAAGLMCMKKFRGNKGHAKFALPASRIVSLQFWGFLISQFNRLASCRSHSRFCFALLKLSDRFLELLMERGSQTKHKLVVLACVSGIVRREKQSLDCVALQLLQTC